jgi:predicted DNA-binding transcriptional regulator AlpA
MSHQILNGEYLTRQELAVELGVSERTIWRWDSARTGPPRTTLGRRVVYRRDGVREWLLGRETEQVRGGRLRARDRGHGS